MGKLNETQVYYGHALSQPAIEFRKKNKEYEAFEGLEDSLRDVCVLYFTNGTWEAGMAFTSCQMKLTVAQHAEEYMIEKFKDSKLPISKVYTELQCCGEGKGMHNCQYKLRQFLKTHGANGKDTPVYYSFSYPGNDKDERNNSVKEFKKILKQMF